MAWVMLTELSRALHHPRPVATTLISPQPLQSLVATNLSVCTDVSVQTLQVNAWPHPLLGDSAGGPVWICRGQACGRLQVAFCGPPGCRWPSVGLLVCRASLPIFISLVVSEMPWACLAACTCVLRKQTATSQPPSQGWRCGSEQAICPARSGLGRLPCWGHAYTSNPGHCPPAPAAGTAARSVLAVGSCSALSYLPFGPCHSRGSRPSPQIPLQSVPRLWCPHFPLSPYCFLDTLVLQDSVLMC